MYYFPSLTFVQPVVALNDLNYYAYMQGVRGEQGSKGETGDIGPRGQQGPVSIIPSNIPLLGNY